MKHYKFLVMKTNGNYPMFLHASFSGGRCANKDTNVTNFKPHDFGGGHQNDDYWNTPEELLVGFSRWYLRTEENTAHNMGNRLYSASDTYRFFRIEDEVCCKKDKQVVLANNDLKSYEVTDKQFIMDMVNSWAFKQVSMMFRDNVVATVRTPPEPVEVVIVYNEETTTWCWISDYFKFEDEDHLEISSVDVPVGLNYEEAVKFISEDVLGCSYRFGGNDAYNKREGLPL